MSTELTLPQVPALALNTLVNIHSYSDEFPVKPASPSSEFDILNGGSF
ncbi:12967_t:CDS:2 [Dentiscutata heterogama]|uniref:12967_t:CDS:1 n=1 Tax=Dentiscutata heterogama TaxID=1316150 RepID=A0ACA9K9L1_9GLOM|nr:12967_t:CDS:2 [Dentiscutata heterogama]